MRGIVMAAVLFVALCATGARAAVERIEITGRVAFAGGKSFGPVGAYEKITGRLHYAVDPEDPANTNVTDIGRVPRDPDGMVRFSGDFLMLRPSNPARGNRRLLYEVGNRGTVAMLSFFNDADSNNRPSSAADAGTGFLFTHGYTLLWSAWNWDVIDGDGRLQIDLPVVLGDDGEPLSGLVSAEITVHRSVESQPLAWGNSRGYPAVSREQADARMTVRNEQRAARREIPRDQWRFARTEDGREFDDPTHVALDGGFRPGLLYEVVYQATRARPVGLGLTAIRDALSFFRYDETDQNPVGGALDQTIIFGISQSGRVITHMLLEGFHVDALDRMVFDAALIHVAGGGKGSFNHRFAQTTRHGSAFEDHQYPVDFFPFTTVPQDDPATGLRGDLLARARAAKAVPKLFFTNTSGEYWTRAASLIHTDVAGATDVALDSNARLYVFAGAQHGNWVVPHRAWFENCINPLDHRPLMRALLLSLDAWISRGRMPPDSVFPRIVDQTLVTVEAYRDRFPTLPGSRKPLVNLRPPRLDLGRRWVGQRIVDRAPPGFGNAFETRVSMPDADGIDTAGVRMPAAAEPLGTYVGWNLRRARFGAPDHIDRWSGSFIPFAIDEAARKAAGDPRPSIAARYPTRGDYQQAIRIAAGALAGDGLLLDLEIPAIVAKGAAFYDRVIARDPDSPSCEYLMP